METYNKDSILNLKTSIILLLLLLSFTVPAQKKGEALRDNTLALDKQKLLFLVNEARSKGCNCGNLEMPPVPPIDWDEQLESAAEKHSQDMSRHNFLGHNGSNGSKFSDRITKAGFAWSRCGENVAQGFETEQQVIEGWLKSPDHCKNIMSREFRFMGVARVGTFWTQDFGTRLEGK
jgi:uncharacterized protein YkwD